MNALLRLSRGIDCISLWVGHSVRWLVLASVLISAGNAVLRKAFNLGSNAYLEVQWYLFSGVFLLGAAYVFLKNAHVRIDFISSKLSKRTNTIIDILGMLLFTVPLSIILVWLSWPVFERAWVSGEVSQNAGGLIRWPVLLLIPVGFAILTAQCVSELIKRFAYLKGVLPEPFTVENEKSDEELLLEELQAKAEAEDAARAAALRAAREVK